MLQYVTNLRVLKIENNLNHSMVIKIRPWPKQNGLKILHI